MNVLWVRRRRTNCRPCCPLMSNPSTYLWTARPDGSGWQDNRLAQHLPQDQIRSSSGLLQLAQTIRSYVLHWKASFIKMRSGKSWFPRATSKKQLKTQPQKNRKWIVCINIGIIFNETPSYRLLLYLPATQTNFLQQKLAHNKNTVNSKMNSGYRHAESKTSTRFKLR